MGLFDKKKKGGRDDFDSPVEQIDLSAANPTGLTGSADDDDGDRAHRVSQPAATAGDRAPAASSAAKAAPSGSSGDAAASRSASSAARGGGSGSGGGGGGRTSPRRPASSAGYGINDAIALMRTLPSENVELVVQVVKHTLESAHIDITAIIEDASGKQERIEGRVAVLRDAIADLEREIATHRKEIGELEADHQETTRVKERLVLAEKLAQSSGSRDAAAAAPDTPAAAPSPPRARSHRPTGGDLGPRTKPPTAPPLPGIPAAPSSSSGSGPTSGGTYPPPITGASGGGSSLSAKPATTHTVIPKK